MGDIKILNQHLDFESMRKDLKNTGCHLIQGAYDVDYCHQLKVATDNCDIPETRQNNKFSGYEVNYGGSELRVWDAHIINDSFRSFYEDCNQIMSALTGKDVKAFTLLAIRNQAIDNYNEALKKGRWHIDSFMKQLKIFLFLTDTDEESGPFEFLPKTHRNLFKYHKLVQGRYIKPLDILRGGKRSYQKLDDTWVEKLASSGYPSVPLVCKAGTLAVVNTSAIHRARPCLNGERYALTAYYR